MKEKLIVSKMGVFVVILFAMGLVLPATGSCFQVTAQVDKTRISPGETVFFQVVVDGGEAKVDLSPIRDFKIVSSGTSTSRTYINGEWAHKVVYQYQLVPEKTGKVVIPALKVSLGKQTLMTDEIQILVSDAPQSPDQSRQLFVQAIVASSDLVVGQQTIYTIRLFAAARFARASLKAPSFDGFVAKEVEERKNYTKTVNGIPYQVTEINYILQAEQPGSFEIAPAIIMADLIQQPSGTDPMDSFFNDPFFSSARTKSVQVASNSLSLGVSPLPLFSGDPPFSGLVGKFTMGAVIDKHELSAGESATLTLTIQGRGNIMDAGSLPVNLDPGKVKVYEDSPTEEMTATNQGFSGKKIFKRALVPVQAGRLVIPGFVLTYFDVEDHAYKTIKTNEIFLDVTGSASLLTTDSRGKENLGAGTGLAPGRPVSPKQEVVMVNKDILDIKDSISILETPFQFDFSVFVLLVLAPGVLYGCFALVLRRRTREKSNKTLMAQRAGHSLKLAEKLAGANKPFLNHAQAGLVAAILAKADKQGESLTNEEARQMLTQTGTDPAIIEEAVALLETMDADRFGKQTMDTSEARLSLGRVKKVIKLLCICLCLLGLFVPHPAVALGKTPLNITQPFIEGIKLYQAGEFKAAAKSFETIAAAGVANPDLFYDIGNAYLKAHDLGHAILWYERAKRMAPGDPDLLFNLAHANTLVKDKIDTPVTLADILFFWQGFVPLKWIQVAAIVSSCLFFLWAGVQRFGKRRIFSGPGWVLISLLVCFFLAAGMEDYKVQSESLAVIVQETVAVRSGIMAGATELFELHAGTRVQVTDQKNGYLKIRLPKGRVGWVRPGDAEVI